MPNYPTTVTVGAICFSCALYMAKQCPYGNHNRSSQLQFKGDIRGKCSYYHPIQIEASGDKDMLKEASSMSDTELNVELYTKIASLSESEREKLFKYWDKLYGPGYAKKMVDEENKSKGKKHPATDNLKKNKKRDEKKEKGKFPEEFKTKE